ncbi:MAG: sigma-70 family RNA polymerase sigma factor [Planctomycetaceae bacterium]
MTSPETRTSLLLRIRDPEDRDAWDQFSDIYRPVICRVARLKGLQEADAEDLAQQVLLSVAGAIERWQPDDGRARFRTWLKRVIENAVLNALTRGLPNAACGGDAMDEFLHQRPAKTDPDSELLRTEYRRELFSRAAQQIRHEFSDDTWNAFWLTAVEGTDVDTAAQQLQRSRGSIYASRSRVMKRLKQKIEELNFEN